MIEVLAYYTYFTLLVDILHIKTKKGRQLLNNIGQSAPRQITITSNFYNSIPNEKDLVKLRDNRIMNRNKLKNKYKVKLIL